MRMADDKRVIKYERNHECFIDELMISYSQSLINQLFAGFPNNELFGRKRFCLSRLSLGVTSTRDNVVVKN